jgi:hypothetical protein
MTNRASTRRPLQRTRPTRPLQPTPCRSLPCSAYHSLVSPLARQARRG